MKAYRVAMIQYSSGGFKTDGGSMDVLAPNASRALQKALRQARTNGFAFLKSQPIQVTSLEEISSDIW